MSRRAEFAWVLGVPPAGFAIGMVLGQAVVGFVLGVFVMQVGLRLADDKERTR